MICPLSRLRPHDPERFKRFYDSGGPDECWNWNVRANRKGYGDYPVGKIRGSKTRRKISAHRLAYALAYGPFNPKLWVLHKCDNPKCVNPAHLFLGDSKSNVDDMCSKGRCNHLTHRVNL